MDMYRKYEGKTEVLRMDNGEEALLPHGHYCLVRDGTVAAFAKKLFEVIVGSDLYSYAEERVDALSELPDYIKGSIDDDVEKDIRNKGEFLTVDYRDADRFTAHIISAMRSQKLSRVQRQSIKYYLQGGDCTTIHEYQEAKQ